MLPVEGLAYSNYQCPFVRHFQQEIDALFVLQNPETRIPTKSLARPSPAPGALKGNHSL